MDFQTAFDLSIGLAGALGGFILRATWDAVQELQESDKDISKKIGEIEVLVAGRYVTRNEMDMKVDAIFHKLDRIENKIDTKLDK